MRKKSKIQSDQKMEEKQGRQKWYLSFDTWSGVVSMRHSLTNNMHTDSCRVRNGYFDLVHRKTCLSTFYMQYHFFVLFPQTTINYRLPNVNINVGHCPFHFVLRQLLYSLIAWQSNLISILLSFLFERVSRNGYL